MDAIAPRPMIFVVDDDVDHCSLLSELLLDANYSVETATSGKQALDRLATTPRPDLILLDLLMPEMDGWDFMQNRRNDPSLLTVPVVVMTGSGDRVLMQAPVASGYLAKPLSPERLLQVVERCLVLQQTKARRASAA